MDSVHMCVRPTVFKKNTVLMLIPGIFLVYKVIAWMSREI
jgi:hypothetical protein